MTGYFSREYAQALSEFGQPRQLQHCEGWILDRSIPGFAQHDAAGLYPLFVCSSWKGFAADLEDLQDGLVSLVLVTDPFSSPDFGHLDQLFNAGVTAFKRHHIVELGHSIDEFVSRHHKRNAFKALESVTVEQIGEPELFLDDWEEMYDVLRIRHDIQGIAAFSRQSFERQFRVPGLIAFRAEVDGVTTGMLLWYVQNNIAYYHLGAYSTKGYELKVSFALFWEAISWFRGKVGWLDLGAGAGIGSGAGGLDRFKEGWATGSRTAYLCRHIFQRDAYEQIVKETGTRGASYFPAYRSVELSTIASSAQGISRDG